MNDLETLLRQEGAQRRRRTAGINTELIGDAVLARLDGVRIGQEVEIPRWLIPGAAAVLLILATGNVLSFTRLLDTWVVAAVYDVVDPYLLASIGP